jgi:hypothetical protein
MDEFIGMASAFVSEGLSQENPNIKYVRDILSAVQSNVANDPEYVQKLIFKSEEELSSQERKERMFIQNFGSLEQFDALFTQLQE